MRWKRITRSDPEYKEVVGRRHSLVNKIVISILVAVLVVVLLSLFVEFVWVEV